MKSKEFKIKWHNGELCLLNSEKSLEGFLYPNFINSIEGLIENLGLKDGDKLICTIK